eukprot:jgi/Mesvir1/25094/Mv21558-RA.1
MAALASAAVTFSAFESGRCSCNLSSAAVKPANVNSAKASVKATGLRRLCNSEGLQAKVLQASIQASSPVRSFNGVKVLNFTSNDLKNGVTIQIDGVPWKVVEFLHVKPGKGAAFVRSTLKNLLTGANVDKTFRAGEKLEQATVTKRGLQHTYVEGTEYVFMDMDTFEEVRLSVDTVGTQNAKYLREGMDVQVLEFNGAVIGVDLVDGTVIREVVMCDPGIKGNTAAGGSKPAELEGGVTVTVPLFVQIGDKVEVNTSTNEYLRRI